MNGAHPDCIDSDPPTDAELAEAAPRCTDSANADAFVARSGDEYRWAVDWETWLADDGARWSRRGASLDLQREILRGVRLDYDATRTELRTAGEDFRKALLADHKDIAEKIEDRMKYLRTLLRWHEQTQNAAKIEAVMRRLQPPLALPIDRLDRHPWLLNCANGTLDLQSAELRPHRREDYLTQITPLDWNESAKCPTWDAFLARAMGGSVQLVLYLQRLIGYSLTGLIREHALAFHYGHGNNGKSTFLRTTQLLLGEYACAAPRNLLFSVDGAPPHPTELARLYAKRLVVCNEVPKGKVFDEAKIKDLTGGDIIAARRMNEDWWDFAPTHKLHLAGNHKPIVLGDDLGIWRRIKLIPWEVTIPDGEIDRDLGDKLRAELPGILRWAVHGCLEWQRVGLSEPGSVQEATAEYRRESDVLGEWLSLACVFEAGARTTKAAIRHAYDGWCKELGHQPVGARTIAQRLHEMGVRRVPVRDRASVKEGWAGLRLKSDLEGFAELPS
jgi:putative DNA primase/helicase